jgi:hypothetical protein
MKNPKALQESLEAAKLMQSHISFKSSIWNSGVFGGPGGMQPGINAMNNYSVNSLDPNMAALNPY